MCTCPKRRYGEPSRARSPRSADWRYLGTRAQNGARLIEVWKGSFELRETADETQTGGPVVGGGNGPGDGSAWSIAMSSRGLSTGTAC